MYILLLALLLMVVGAVLTGIIALEPVTAKRNKTANTLGPGIAAIACLLGLLGVFTSGWNSIDTFQMSWGLPFGALAFGLDPLSRLFLLPVFILGLSCALAGGIYGHEKEHR